ncbi:MAG: tetratricopeptide repeat protein [Saprospiraceae bacterium]|nr:tetratricopeptide repeat protein [Saprospiraceae bacterium]
MERRCRINSFPPKASFSRPGAGLLLFLLLPFALFSQAADSLARLLKTAPPDTHRVILLTDLAWEINETETDAAAARLDEAIRLAQQLRFVPGEATAWNGLGVVEEIRGNWAKAIEHYQKALQLREQIGEPRLVAASLNNLGVAYENLGEYDNALAYHRRNLDIVRQLRDTVRIARAHLNIAGVYERFGFYPEAFDEANNARYLQEARHENGYELAKTYTMLGHVRYETGLWLEAARWYRESLRLRQALDDPYELALAYNDLGNALDEFGDKKNNTDSSKAAISYYEKALQLYRDLEDEPGIADVLNNLGTAYKHLGQYDKALRLARDSEVIRLRLDDQQGLMETYNTLGDTYYRLKKYAPALEYTRRYHDIAQRIGNENYLQKAYKDFAEIYAGMGNYKQAYEYHKRYEELRYRRLGQDQILFFEQREGLFTDMRRKDSLDLAAREVERQRTNLALQDAELDRARIRTWAVVGGALALAALALLLYNRNRMRARANRELAAKNALIEQERQRADQLLYNILPAETAEELKANNTVHPVRYESVTVMFTDFEGFTKIAEYLSPEELIGELNECFLLFDAIVERYGLEKIKTIGDAYMCAGGLPTPNNTHPLDVVRAALDMQAELAARMSERKTAGRPVFAMRVGIHTGPVVAGVVGSHKFAYDIWGDTVNTAARLEEEGVTGRVNISDTTYQLVKNHFACSYRGELEAKHKGRIKMWFVESRL